ncbi:MAG: trypsin-like peptidase domain-containing protein [Fimbriimonadaceae bacterium]
MVCSGFLSQAGRKIAFLTADHCVGEVQKLLTCHNRSKGTSPVLRLVLPRNEPSETVALDPGVLARFRRVPAKLLRFADCAALVLPDGSAAACSGFAIPTLPPPPSAKRGQVVAVGFKGTPSEIHDEGVWKLEKLILPLKRLNRRAKYSTTWNIDWGRAEPEDLKGMSGGPVVHVSEDGLRVVGVVSAQYGQPGKPDWIRVATFHPDLLEQSG